MLTLKKQHSTIEAAISAPNPPVTGASWLIYMPFIDHQDTHQPASMKHSQKEITLTRSLPVFLTEASTVSLSQGIRVFRSISSQEIPSWKILMLISVSTVFYFYFFSYQLVLREGEHLWQTGSNPAPVYCKRGYTEITHTVS